MLGQAGVPQLRGHARSVARRRAGRLAPDDQRQPLAAVGADRYSATVITGWGPRSATSSFDCRARAVLSAAAHHVRDRTAAPPPSTPDVEGGLVAGSGLGLWVLALGFGYVAAGLQTRPTRFRAFLRRCASLGQKRAKRWPGLVFGGRLGRWNRWNRPNLIETGSVRAQSARTTEVDNHGGIPRGDNPFVPELESSARPSQRQSARSGSRGPERWQYIANVASGSAA